MKKIRYENKVDQPLVTVIVPTYNRAKWLPVALNSLVNQTYEFLDIVVINDGGADVSEITRAYNDPRIRYFQHDENKGLAAARNTGLTNAKGRYFCFLDDDDYYFPLAIEFRMDQMKKNAAEIVYTRALQNILEKNKDQYVSVHKQLYWDSPFDKDLILIQNIAPCCCPLFSRRAWDDSGNYLLDTNLTTGEDQDFWNALSRKNDFVELKLIDCECTYRNEPNGQMTGTRNFAKNLPIIYKRWRDTATPEKKQWVIENQNNILRNAGLKPEDYGL
jgi:glycosyltransferase involved in cell wall biosynthesis